MTTEPIVEQVKQALAEAAPLFAVNFDSDALTISAVLYEPRTLDEYQEWPKLTPEQARALVPLAGRFFDSSPKVDNSLTEEEALACIAQIEAMLAHPTCSAADACEFINEGLTRDEVVLVQIGPAHWRVEA